ncbi:hypothetical protein [Clostridium estertheticum]|uniref:hypothetical protein n=1 Tax=Clostridium estertheticum TaxID=238834 RepID=UPI001CF11029|nr:hypothetical protein [Clostridium estertheticum]MCB2354717.1 hypothetical protein [Clostridium estertheticum]WAG40959.1 hypothetical protein LL065_22395 [Clostridium estertheticum]
MESINSKISRKRLYKRIYEPCESIKTDKICEDSNGTFYDEAVKLLALMYLTQKGEC